MKIAELMTRDVQTVTPDTDLVTVAKHMKELNVGVIPVVEGQTLVGLITDRDLVIRALATGIDVRDAAVRDYISASPSTVSPQDDVKRAAELMAREQIRRLPVVEGGKLVGIVSLGDIAVDTGKDTLSGDALEQISEPSQPRSQQRGS